MTDNELITTYSSSHQNPTNQQIHFVCVPIIFFNVVALMYYFLPLIIMAALVLGSLVFYYRSMRQFLPSMIVLYFITLGLSAIFASHPYFVHAQIVMFVLAWIGQFWGHKIEGKKPSFFEDLLFLLVGPAWVTWKLKNKILGQ